LKTNRFTVPARRSGSRSRRRKLEKVGAVDDTLCREQPGTQGIAYAETSQQVLESGLFADNRMGALQSGAGQPESQGIKKAVDQTSQNILVGNHPGS
jgi:hypothetical protein